MLNFWEMDDFSLINMTEAINVLEVPPSRIASMGLFQSEGINTTFIGVENANNTLRLIPSQPRGTMPEYKATNSRTMRAIQIPHLPKNGTVWADQYQNVREFGTDDQLAAPIKAVNSKLEELKAEHELTKEYHRLGALQGKIYDADGTTLLYDLFDLFNVTRTTLTWDSTLDEGFMLFAMAIKRAMSDAMQGVPYTGIHVFVGETFWDKMTTHASTRDAFASYQENVYSREGAPVNSQFFYQGIMWEEYRGVINATPFVPDAEAFAFPISKAGVYKERWAPAPFMETVNTIGKEYYAKQEPLKFDVGVEIHTNSNPVYIMTKPKALLKLTFTE